MKRIVLLLSVYVLSFSAMAEEAKQELEAHLNSLKTFKAQFQQSITSTQRGVQDTSNGMFYLARPGKFNWEYQTPFEQSIIADGEKIWIYDKDLDQVTVRNMQQALADSPALLLSENVSVSEQFTVTKETTDDKRDWFSLTPKSQENQYVSIKLVFLAGVISEMQLNDAFGQETRIVFTRQEQNQTLDDSLFKFVPPEGVDVLNADGLVE